MYWTSTIWGWRNVAIPCTSGRNLEKSLNSWTVQSIPEWLGDMYVFAIKCFPGYKKSKTMKTFQEDIWTNGMKGARNKAKFQGAAEQKIPSRK